jgi:tRNA-dihydrouridine synthase B
MINLMIQARAVLAPMAGVTDIPFRLMCRKFGCRFAFTEMVDVSGMAYQNRKTLKYLERLPEDTPLGAQIVGQDEKKLVEAARICEAKGFEVIDLNAGCPARKVVKGGKGSALLKDPLKLGGLVENIVKSVSVPLTVKIRSGWDGDSLNYMEVARVLESSGASAICIHPRTKDQMYRGSTISHDPTREIKTSVKIPVFASGNIFSAEDAMDVLDGTGCDGVFIARGSLGRPWIFRDAADLFAGKEKHKAPEFNDLKSIMEEHYRISEDFYGEFLTAKRMYKHLTWYLKRYKNLNEIMRSYQKVKNIDGFRVFLDRLSLDGRNLVLN